MAKNQINFTKMSNEAMEQLKSFKESAFQLAVEDVRYKSEKKYLDAELSTILTNRKNNLDNGLSIDEVAEKFPRTEIDNKIRKAQEKHTNITKPLNDTMKATYVFVPGNMYESYVKKIEEGKRGEFLDAIKIFLVNLGLEELKQGQINKFAESMSDRFGAKYATSKRIKETGAFTMSMKKQQFNKLFMAVFCDMYIKQNMV